MTAVVHDADVAGAQVAVVGEGFGCFFGLLVVAPHHVRAPDADFAGAPGRQAVAVVVLDGDVDAGQRQTDGAAEFGAGDRVVGADGAGFAHAPAFDHGTAGDALPVPCRAFRGRHAAGLRQHQAGKVELAKTRVVEQAVEQGVDGWQQVEGALLQHVDELADIARVGDERHVGPLAHGQQAEREGEDVVQRQGGDVVGPAHVADLLQCGVEPGFGLQRGGNDVAVGEDGALGQAGGAAGVLQEGNAVVVDRGRLQAQGGAALQRLAKRTHRAGTWRALQGQAVGRHHLGQVAHRKRDPAAEPVAQQVAHGRHHHMPDGGAVDDLFQGVAEVFQDDDGLGPRVGQLVFELARGVQRVDVDTGVAGPQHTGHGDRELRHVGQHDGHPGPGRQTQRLQVGPQGGTPLVQLTIAHPAVHAHRDRVLGVPMEGGLQQLVERPVLGRVDVVRDACGVALQPDLVHDRWGG